MRRLLLSMAMLGLTSVLAIGATTAYFSDTETSSANTFTAGTLDLDLDSGVTAAKFNVSQMKPGSQRIGTWRLTNTGTINGFVDIEDIIVTNYEDGCLESEESEGDDSCNPGDQGELQNLVSLSSLFWDENCNGWVGTEDRRIYDGKAGDVPDSFETNEPLAAGETKCISAQFNWWSNGSADNLGQGDSFTMDFGFELGQKSDQ